jgi:hypothetical protein
MTTERLLPPQRERWKMATADTHLLLSRDIDLYYGFLGANQPLISDVFLYEHKLYKSPTPTAAIGSLEPGLNQGRGVVIHLSIHPCWRMRTVGLRFGLPKACWSAAHWTPGRESRLIEGLDSATIQHYPDLLLIGSPAFHNMEGLAAIQKE